MMTSDRQLPDRASNASAALRVTVDSYSSFSWPLPVERLDQRALRAVLADQRRHVRLHVAAHVGAQREDAVRADRFGRRAEQRVVEQIDRNGRALPGRRRARGEREGGGDEGCRTKRIG